MRTTFRYLEDFITKHCSKVVKPIKFAEERLIRTPMVNCKKWMGDSHLQTFYKLIRVAVKQEKEEIAPQSAL